jgi:hypothetical protein
MARGGPAHFNAAADRTRQPRDPTTPERLLFEYTVSVQRANKGSS